MYSYSYIYFRILPWWEYWTFCFGLKKRNLTVWHEVLRLYEETKDKTILNSLLCTQHTQALIGLLYSLAKNGTKLIKKADLPDFIHNMIKQHINDDQLFSYILNEFMLFK